MTQGLCDLTYQLVTNKGSCMLSYQLFRVWGRRHPGCPNNPAGGMVEPLSPMPGWSRVAHGHSTVSQAGDGYALSCSYFSVFHP